MKPFGGKCYARELEHKQHVLNRSHTNAQPPSPYPVQRPEGNHKYPTTATHWQSPTAPPGHHRTTSIPVLLDKFTNIQDFNCAFSKFYICRIDHRNCFQWPNSYAVRKCRWHHSHLGMQIMGMCKDIERTQVGQFLPFLNQACTLRSKITISTPNR